MKIIYLHQYFNTLNSPGCTRSYEMARRLVQSGHEVQMVTSLRQGKADSPSWFETREDDIQMHWLPVPYLNHMSYQKRIKAFFQFALKAGPKAASLGGDVILAMSSPLTIALPAVYAAKKNKIPMVFEIGDLWPALPIAVGALKNPATITAARWLERFAYRNSARIITLSPGMKEGVMATGYPEERITVIPNSCDMDLFDVPAEAGRKIREKYDWLGERPLVLYAGTIGIINGVDFLARLAAETLNIDPEIRFLVIGTGKEENRVKEEAERLGVFGRNFFMLPPVPKTEMPGWLNTADIATSVFTGIKLMETNSANKFFDALAAGKPIALNYGGWQADILRESDAGLVLNRDDIPGSAKLLSRAIRDKAWSAKAGAAARGIARERFDRDELALRLEETLEAALREEPKVGKLKALPHRA